MITFPAPTSDARSPPGSLPTVSREGPPPPPYQAEDPLSPPAYRILDHDCDQLFESLMSDMSLDDTYLRQEPSPIHNIQHEGTIFQQAGQYEEADAEFAHPLERRPLMANRTGPSTSRLAQLIAQAREPVAANTGAVTIPHRRRTSSPVGLANRAGSSMFRGNRVVQSIAHIGRCSAPSARPAPTNPFAHIMNETNPARILQLRDRSFHLDDVLLARLRGLDSAGPSQHMNRRTGRTSRTTRQ